MARIPWALVVVLCTVPVVAAQTVGDGFDDDVVDAAKWGPDDVGGQGGMNEVNHRLEYTVGAPTAEDSVDRTWRAGVGPYDASWEVQVDVFDATSPDQADQVSSFGIDISSEKDPKDEFYAELYASSLGGPSSLRRGFNADLLVDGALVGSSDTGDLGVTSGAVRIAFDAATKVVTVFYDVDPSDGYAWMQLASYGVAGSGGVDGNGDFAMSSGDVFVIAVYGYSTALAVTSGQMYGDNFLTTGLLPTTPPACPSVPRTGCRRAAARTGALIIKDKPGSAKDMLGWKWGKGAATAKADFGDPLGASSYQLCMYDGSGMRLDAVAPAGRPCGGKSCWKATKPGYRFRDKSLGADGILLLLLNGGSDGKAKIALKAKGANLGPPRAPLVLPVTVQLARSDEGPCWESTFAMPTKNAAGQFKARSD